MQKELNKVIRRNLLELINEFKKEKMNDGILDLVKNVDFLLVEEDSKKGILASYLYQDHSIAFYKEAVVRKATEEGRSIEDVLLYAFTHEMRHVWQFAGGFDIEVIDADLLNPEYMDRKIEKDAYAFTDKYLAKRGR